MKFDLELFEDTLAAGSLEMGMELAPEIRRKMAEFSTIILRANRRLNLTRLVKPREMAVKHFLDSLSILLLDLPKKAACLDLGTGAGFPGLPLALVKDEWSWHLVDSLRKRVLFLKRAVDDLGITNVQCSHARAEEMGRQSGQREKYDLVVSRAVAPLPILLELGSPLAAVGGKFIAYKGAESGQELKESETAMKELKMRLEQAFPLELPFAMGERNLLLFEKIGPTPGRYPRRPGIPEKRPLL